MADAAGLGPVVRKDVGVQSPLRTSVSGPDDRSPDALALPRDVMPTFHSADAPRAIEWLTRVLGLREVVAHKDPRVGWCMANSRTATPDGDDRRPADRVRAAACASSSARFDLPGVRRGPGRGDLREVQESQAAGETHRRTRPAAYGGATSPCATPTATTGPSAPTDPGLASTRRAGIACIARPRWRPSAGALSAVVTSNPSGTKIGS